MISPVGYKIYQKTKIIKMQHCIGRFDNGTKILKSRNGPTYTQKSTINDKNGENVSNKWGGNSKQLGKNIKRHLYFMSYTKISNK